MTLSDFMDAQIARIKREVYQQTFEKRGVVNPRNVLKRYQAPSDAKADRSHGTLYSYKNLKCRCDVCREANAAASARQRRHVSSAAKFNPVQPSMFEGVA